MELAVALALFVMLINLRGVRESGSIFAIPTYFFVVMMFITVGVGMFRYLTGTLGGVADPPPMEALGGPAALTHLPDPPCLLVRHDCAHGRRGDRERCSGVQGAAQP